ncbi:MAG: hypothetical protein Q9M41_11450 [Paracoccaceae bacterium]|nr:hypothetical protein [Paracoccaceae bacterium]
MMLSLIAFFIGAAIGALTAWRRGGNRLDILQYAAVFGVIFALVAVLGAVFGIRMGWF